MSSTSRPGLAARLGLGRRELVGWAFYDCANSAFWAPVLQIFPVYFINVACAGIPAARANARYAYATALALTVVALLAPILGAVADYRGIKKRLLLSFAAFGVPATAAMFFVGRGDWKLGLVVYILANIGVAGSLGFYDALLPHVARADEVDRVSTAGFALGYLGSGVMMALSLVVMARPGWFGLPDAATAVRVGLLASAVWWGLFTLPLWRWVGEPPPVVAPGERPDLQPVRVAFSRLRATLHDLRRYRDAFMLLLAFLIYNDGINTIIRMAAPYGTEIGIPAAKLLAAILVVQFVGVPCTFLFGWLADRIGVKRAIYLALGVYLIITVFAYQMRTATHFFILATLVGLVQGGAQALSRSLFATLIPRQKSAEFFAFFGVFDKFAGIVGPALFGVVIDLTGTSRAAILALVIFFIVGGSLLTRVDIRRGRRAASEAVA